MQQRLFGLDRPAVCVAYLREGNGERSVTIDRMTYTYLWDKGQARAEFVDGDYMAFPVDRPLEWDDVMPEGRGI